MTHKQIILKHQIIGTLTDPDTLHHLNKWKGIDSIADGTAPIVVEPPQETNATYDEMNHINNILSMKELAEEQCRCHR